MGKKISNFFNNSVSWMVFYNFVYKCIKEQYLSLCEIRANKNSCSLFKLKNICFGDYIKYLKNFFYREYKAY